MDWVCWLLGALVFIIMLFQQAIERSMYVQREDEKMHFFDVLDEGWKK
tara:strand:+ start:24843 stop:24986 length:144 start_codon:yes stop_codon:yes gene_type:complete